MKKKVGERFLKFAWPVIKFVIVNYGQTISKFIFESLKAKTRKNRIQKMEDALKHAENAESAAESTEDPQAKMQYYEIAKTYKEEAEYQRRFLSEFLDELEKSSDEIMETVKKNASQVEVEDLFVIDKKKGELKAAEEQKVLGKIVDKEDAK